MANLPDVHQTSKDVERKVLILKPSALGDIVMAFPAVRSIKRGLPGARIYWLVNKGLAGILEGNPNVDDVIEFDREKLGRMWCSAAGWEEFRTLVARLRSEKFDVVLDFQGLMRTAVLGRLSGCKVRIGMRDAREGAPFLYSDLVTRPAGTEHVVDYYAEMAELLWVDGGMPVFEFGKNEVADASARQILKDEGVNGPYAVLVAGASDPAKQWPLERFAQAAERISQEYGLAIVATGSLAEGPAVRRLAGLAGAKVADLAGKTNVQELAAVIRGAKLVVGNDTGPTHIAAAMGLPVAVIFGLINPARLYPYGRKQCVAAVEPWSRPTGIRTDDRKYMVENVTFDMVWDVIKEQMKDYKRQSQ
jgi:heptosyltransferase I